jgi:hypothetical protein
MSWLSARTYSCGGEGSLFGLGGEASFGGCAEGGGTFEKNFNIPFCFLTISSSSDGADDSPEESAGELMVVRRVVEYCVEVMF